ncbi:hypothetical protein GYMLUDRAFT_251850 [Collybiopsis luxurians FD-317 M1]|uniref:Uncharacterized protein n=1 Tax=Collybiopsis luxurians FD-317 M1 TaxID=944289 RepID=A0A0D0CA62_9AGAR|nr:hypothetical protein GYMLUDRAFT_251850 [Collybiopsis luxurians FD-317 M1]
MHELFQQIGGSDVMTTVRAVENLNSTISSLSAAISSLQSGTGNSIETSVHGWSLCPNTAVPNAPAAPSAVTSVVPTTAVPPAPSTLGPVRTSWGVTVGPLNFGSVDTANAAARADVAKALG